MNQKALKYDSTATVPPTERQVNAFRKALLAWYDKNRRTLPWRALPGQTADPYHVWLSEVMLQQTVVAAVIPYFLKFVEKWPDIHALAEAPAEDVMAAWAGLGYYTRARNLHKCAKEIATRGGAFPVSADALKNLPGIGDYTSAAITAIAFDNPATVVDGNVERVVARYFKITEPLPAAKKAIREYAGYLSESRADRPGDFAQSMMDLGATICTPRSPRCGLCPLQKNCAGQNMAESLPARVTKKKKPQRFGHIYWITNDQDAVLLERRPEKGLLASTIGFPTSAWTEGKKPEHAPFAAAPLKGVVAPKNLKIFHSFTHFDLTLQGWTIRAKHIDLKDKKEFFWVDGQDVPATATPSIFKKFIRLMIEYI